MSASILDCPAGWMFALGLLAGCSPTLGVGSVDASAYAAMTCGELNAMVGGVSKNLSQTAINRGKVARTDIPAWAPGAERVASAVIDRQTARIEALQQQERAVAAARDGACTAL